MSIAQPTALSYMGETAIPFIIAPGRAPGTNPNFNIPTVWVDPISSDAYMLVRKANNLGTWINLGVSAPAGPITSITGNNGAPFKIGPDGAANVNILGDATTIVINGDALHTLTAALVIPVTVPHGGTGLTTLPIHGVLIGQDAADIHISAVGAAGRPFIGNGAGVDPSFCTSLIIDDATTYVTHNGQYFIQTAANIGANNGLLIRNTDGTNIASGCILELQTEATGGDAFSFYEINGANAYSLGIDNSDSDKLKLTTGNSPSAGTTLLTVDPAGNQIFSHTRDFVSLGTLVGGRQLLACANHDATNLASDACIQAYTVNGGGDAYLSCAKGGVWDWQLGLDHTDSSFKLGHGGAPSAMITFLKVATTGAITFDNAYTFPTTDGTAGQQLQTNGAGVVTWASGHGGGVARVVRQVFTANGLYTPTAGMLYCDIEVVGGGGAGGGNSGSAGNPNCGCGGGGGGGYAKKIVSAATIGVGQAVTVGAGGVGVVDGTGGTGGTTSVGAIVSASGGTGGIKGWNATMTYPIGGSGGTGVSGDYNLVGMCGGYGVGGMLGGQYFLSGAGGNSHFGAGAIYVVLHAGSSSGYAATSYGGGGSGAVMSDGGGGSHAGGNGYQGVVVITEYCS